MSIMDKLEKQEEQKTSEKQANVKEILAESGIVDKIIEMYDRFSDMVKRCFSSSPLFERNRHTAFESFMNRDIGSVTMSELLATYTDKMLRKGGMKMGED